MDIENIISSSISSGIIYFYIAILVVFIISAIIVLVNLNSKKIELENIERELRKMFMKRTNLILALHALAKPHSSKTDMIFKSIMDYRKIEIFSSKSMNLAEFVKLESKIHYELSFIIQYINSIDVLTNNWNMLYIKDNILLISEELWKKINSHREKTKKYNKVLFMKNLTLIWIFFPFKRWIEI